MIVDDISRNLSFYIHDHTSRISCILVDRRLPASVDPNALTVNKHCEMHKYLNLNASY